MGKVHVYRQRFTMVFIMARIIAETCFMRKMGIVPRLHCLLGEACNSLAISLVDAKEMMIRLRVGTGDGLV